MNKNKLLLIEGITYGGVLGPWKKKQLFYKNKVIKLQLSCNITLFSCSDFILVYFILYSHTV